MHKSEVVAEHLRQFNIRFNTYAQHDDPPPDLPPTRTPVSRHTTHSPPPDYLEICIMPKEDEAKTSMQSYNVDSQFCGPGYSSPTFAF